MRKRAKILLLFLLFITTAYSSYAYVYPKIVSKEKIVGKVDCWLIKYQLWETNNTTTPLDDTMVGAYTTIVGDCNDATGNMIQPENILIGEKEMEYEDLEVFPNPVASQMEILFSISNELKGCNWTIFDITGAKNISGVFNKKSHKQIFELIDVSSLKSGIYLFTINNGEKVVYKKFIKS